MIQKKIDRMKSFEVMASVLKLSDRSPYMLRLTNLQSYPGANVIRTPFPEFILLKQVNISKIMMKIIIFWISTQINLKLKSKSYYSLEHLLECTRF